MTKRSNLKKIAVLLLLTVAVLPLTGCVERKLTLNTVPQGALITLNDEEIGTTPVTVGFNWYGDYRVHVTKEGYETLNTHRNLEAPTHDKFPLDFFYGVLWPGRIVDEYEWTFKLKTYTPPARQELIDAAQKIRETASKDLNKAAAAAQRETELK